MFAQKEASFAQTSRLGEGPLPHVIVVGAVRVISLLEKKNIPSVSRWTRMGIFLRTRMMLNVSLSPGQATISWSPSSVRFAISEMSCGATRSEYLSRDQEIPEFMRRANLDAFWSWESSTVKSNLGKAMRIERTAFRLGMPSMTPHMGPWPLEDSQGMSAALAVLDRSLDKGKYKTTVQWDTFRRSKLAITNISQAAVGGLENSVGAYERSRMWIWGSVTHKFWFARFMSGVHKRVGQVRKPDKELTIDVIHAVDKLLETEWQSARRSDEKKKIAEMGAWFIGGFCTGLRGKEMILIELARTANSLVHMDDVKHAHFLFVVSGWTKANQLS
jgi:hypothetical protein